MMFGKDVKVTVNGQELFVSELTLEQDVEHAYPNLSIRGFIKELRYGVSTSDYEDCNEKEKAVSNCYQDCADNGSLVRKYNDISKGKDHAVLRKAGVISSDGVLTESGERLLLQLLLEENREKVVEAVKAATAKEE